MIRLNSSSIRAVDYDPTNRRLYIWFPNSGPYTFYGVPPPIFQGLISAGSAGRYYNQNIRGKYAA